MPSQSQARLLSCHIVTRGASIATIMLSSLVLTGWAFDIQTFKSILPIWVSMKTNTALSFMLAGVSLWLSHTQPVRPAKRRVAQACAVSEQRA